MTYFIYLENGIAIEDADSEEDAIELAKLVLIDWIQQDGKAGFELIWLVEQED